MIDQKTQALLDEREKNTALKGRYRRANFSTSTLNFFTGTSFFLGLAGGTVAFLGAIGLSVAVAPFMLVGTVLGVGAGTMMVYASYRADNRIREIQINAMKRNEEKIKQHFANADKNRRVGKISELVTQLAGMNDQQLSKLKMTLDEANPFCEHLAELALAAKFYDQQKFTTVLDKITEEQKQSVEQQQVNVAKETPSGAKFIEKAGLLRTGLIYGQRGKIFALSVLSIVGGFLAAGVTLGAPAIIAASAFIGVSAALVGLSGFLAKRTLDKARHKREEHVNDLKEVVKDAKNSSTACSQLKDKAQITLLQAEKIAPEAKLQQKEFEAQVKSQVVQEVHPELEVISLKTEPLTEEIEEICGGLPGTGATDPLDPISRLIHAHDHELHAPEEDYHPAPTMVH